MKNKKLNKIEKKVQKKKNYLLRGGIIGAIIGLIGKILSLTILYLDIFLLHIIFNPFELIISLMCIVAVTPFCNNLVLLYSIGFVITIIIFFVAGVFIAWIYKIIKSRGEK